MGNLQRRLSKFCLINQKGTKCQKLDEFNNLFIKMIEYSQTNSFESLL